MVADATACLGARWGEVSGKHIELRVGDVVEYDFLAATFQEFKPDAVVRNTQDP